MINNISTGLSTLQQLRRAFARVFHCIEKWSQKLNNWCGYFITLKIPENVQHLQVVYDVVKGRSTPVLREARSYWLDTALISTRSQGNYFSQKETKGMESRKILICWFVLHYLFIYPQSHHFFQLPALCEQCATYWSVTVRCRIEVTMLILCTLCGLGLLFVVWDICH